MHKEIFFYEFSGIITSGVKINGTGEMTWMLPIHTGRVIFMTRCAFNHDHYYYKFYEL